MRKDCGHGYIVESDISGNKEGGISIGGGGTIEMNSISANNKGGITIIYPAGPFKILENTISNNKGVGVGIMGTESYQEPLGGYCYSTTISGNEIFGNAGGIYIAFALVGLVNDNKIYNNADCGILMEEGGGLCTNNQVYNNGDNYCGYNANLYCQ